MISLHNFGEILIYATIIPTYIIVVMMLISHRAKRNKIGKEEIYMKEI